MRRVLRRVGLATALLVGVFLVGRAIVELVTVDPNQPSTYRDDWGGPSYLGVILVHAGPGLLVLAVLVLTIRRRHRRTQDR